MPDKPILQVIFNQGCFSNGFIVTPAIMESFNKRFGEKYDIIFTTEALHVDANNVVQLFIDGKDLDRVIYAIDHLDPVQSGFAYPYVEGRKMINGVSFPVWSSSEVSHGVWPLKVTAGSTGSRGGDSGHGGRTFLKIETDDSGLDFRVKRIEDKANNFVGFEISAGGDWEFQSLVTSLEFALRAFRAAERRAQKERTTR